MTSTKIDDKDILNLAKRTAGQNSDDILAFDITFTDKDGNEKQPNSYVKVSINPKDYNLDAERYALVHIDGEKNAKYLGNIAVSNGLLTFYANSFSIYAIIPTTQTDQQRYARNTYEFYVNDELVASQIVRNGDILNAPAAPSLECLIFMGWYTENDRLFNGLNLAVNIPDGTTADKTIKLHAKFADKIYSVLFFNPQGNVLATKTGTNGDNINTDDIRHEVKNSDKEMFDWVKANGYEPVIIATKADKITRNQLPKQLKLIREGLGVQKASEITIFPFSALTKQGRDEIWNAISTLIS